MKSDEKNLNVRDISELGKHKKKSFRSFFSKSEKRPRIIQNEKKQCGKNAVTEYLSKRRFNIVLFFAVSLIGIFTGVFYSNSLDSEKLEYLRRVNDNLNINLSSSDMLVKILNSVIINGLCVFILFLTGLTIFAPASGSLICFVKGIFSGYMTGVLLNSTNGTFDILICSLTLIFNTFIMLFFILSASECLGFSLFILKNEESYRNSLSFSNISFYSLRHFIFFILVCMFGILQTITIPLVYSMFF